MPSLEIFLFIVFLHSLIIYCFFTVSPLAIPAKNGNFFRTLPKWDEVKEVDFGA